MAKHEHAILDLDVAVGGGGEPIAGRSDLARLQRANKGAEQSAAFLQTASQRGTIAREASNHPSRCNEHSTTISGTRGAGSS
jgi:hypothetical protein